VESGGQIELLFVMIQVLVAALHIAGSTDASVKLMELGAQIVVAVPVICATGGV